MSAFVLCTKSCFVNCVRFLASCKVFQQRQHDRRTASEWLEGEMVQAIVHVTLLWLLVISKGRLLAAKHAAYLGLPHHATQKSAVHVHIIICLYDFSLENYRSVILLLCEHSSSFRVEARSETMAATESGQTFAHPARTTSFSSPASP